MSVSRPHRLKVGARVYLNEAIRTVVGLDGAVVLLAAPSGQIEQVTLADLMSAEDFEIVGRSAPPSPSASAALSGLSEKAAERALWWEQQIVELLTGLPPHPQPGRSPRPEYDPEQRTLTEREEAKAAELSDLGSNWISVHTVRRKRRRYEAHGLAGVVDGRLKPKTVPTGRIDPRVVEAAQELINEATDASTRTAGYLCWRIEQLITQRHGPGKVVIPSRATFYRLLDKLTHGRHTTGSARTRRSLANRPDGAFGQVTASRPGELVEIDSTPLDVLVLLERGVAGRVELTGMIDLATRSVIAVTLVPTTKSVDASALLARAVTPEPMRPGWKDALRLAESVLPYERMLKVDDRLELAASRPVVIPETIVCDRGNVYVSRNFRSSCAALGINFQPTHPGTPTDKPHIERTIATVGTLFCQYVSGYLGSSVEHRGRNVEDEPLWSMHQLQDLLDEWIIAAWQNRPHDGLRDPAAPGRAFTPNEKYASLIEASGYVPLALSSDDYIELLPAVWRAINSYGIKLRRRTYDSDELNPLRGQRSGIKHSKDLWEIHYDPYDISRIWVRNHWDGGWITAPWKHLASLPMPFGELAWDHARRTLSDQGQRASEENLSEAVNDLLTRAHRGPQDQQRDGLSNAERRVVARTETVNRSADAPPEPAPATAPIGDDDEDDIADVVPLRPFNAREEAEHWW